MISSAEEFVSLRSSELEAEYLRAATDEAPIPVWLDVIDRFPEMRTWVAHNKTVPLEILEVLQRDSDPSVRFFVAMKNKLSPQLFALLAEDAAFEVRSRIVYNKQTPPEILLKLEGDSDPMISLQARKRRMGSYCD